jgi:hypothetical protein
MMRAPRHRTWTAEDNASSREIAPQPTSSAKPEKIGDGHEGQDGIAAAPADTDGVHHSTTRIGRGDEERPQP